MTKSESPESPESVIKKIAQKRYEQAQAKKGRKKPAKPKPKPKPPEGFAGFNEDEIKEVYDEVLLDRELGERSLAEYAKLCWPYMHGTKGIPFIDTWHNSCVAEHLQALVEGQIKKLLISIPPGHAKSSYAAVFLPTWGWLQKPEWKMAFGSYNYTNVLRDAEYCVKLIKSKWWQQRWGDQFNLVKTAFRDIQNSMGGRRMGVSVGGHTLGIRAQLICADDPLNIKEADSEVARAKVQSWWTGGMRTRGDVDRVELVIMQRLHDYDLIGYLQAEIGGYQELILPSEYIPSRKCVTLTVDGTKFWEDPRKEEGELLFPEKYPKSYLLEQEGHTDRTRNEYASMFQQDPVQPGGNIIKKKWFHFYTCTPEEQYAKCTRAILSCDLAMKDKETSSFSVVQIWGIWKTRICLIDQTRRRVGFTEKVATIKSMIEKWNAADGPGISAKLIEDKASGPDVIDVLKDLIPGMIPFDGNDDKEERMNAISYLWEAGNVYVPGKRTKAEDEVEKIDWALTPWMLDWYDEVTRFPKSAFSDQAVTMSQALVYISRTIRAGLGVPVLIKGSGQMQQLREFEAARRQI